MLGVLLFAAVALTFGYAFGGPLAWAAGLGLPTVVGLATVWSGGFDNFNALVFLLTLVLCAAGVVLGTALRARAARETNLA